MKKLIGHIVKKDGEISYEKIMSAGEILNKTIADSRFAMNTIPEDSMLFGVICEAMQAYADQEKKAYHQQRLSEVDLDKAHEVAQQHNAEWGGGGDSFQAGYNWLLNKLKNKT